MPVVRHVRLAWWPSSMVTPGGVRRGLRVVYQQACLKPMKWLTVNGAGRRARAANRPHMSEAGDSAGV